MMNTTHLLPSLVLLWAIGQPLALVHASSPAPGAESSTDRQAKYDAAQTELRAAEIQGDDDPGPGSCTRLEAALSDVEQYGGPARRRRRGPRDLDVRAPDLDPQLLQPEQGQRTRQRPARRHAANRHDPKYILDKFKPYFGDKVDKTREKLEREGKAKLRVVCHSECTVALNTVPTDAREIDVHLGKHEVVVRSVDGSVTPTSVEVELEKRGQVEVIEFGLPPEPEVAAEPEVVEPAKVDRHRGSAGSSPPGHLPS